MLQQKTYISNNKSPIVSVVMPVLNGEKYLREAIESICSQTFTDWELIIINDGSTDNTPSILREYAIKDTRIRVITHMQKMGLAPSINDGIRASYGKYIARFDSDDISLPHRFETQYNFLEMHPEIFLVGSGYAVFNEQGPRIKVFHPSSSLLLAWSFLSNTRFGHPTVMFRKLVIDLVGMYPITGAEDFAFFSRVVQQFRCVNLPIALIKYREHATNYSVTARSEVNTSVKETYYKNFLHYVGNLQNADVFYQYHAQDTLRFADLIVIQKINEKIIKLARTQYRMSFWNPQSLSIIVFLMKKNVRALTRTLTQNIIAYLKRS